MAFAVEELEEYATEVKETVHSNLTDEALAELVQNGNTDHFGALVDRYEKKLLRYGAKFLARGEDIEDIVQEIFMKSFQNIRSFRTSERFSPWIYRIAHNEFVNALKKQQRAPLYLFDFDTLIPHPHYEDPKETERELLEMKQMLEKGLEQLQPKYREVLILHYLEELEYKEISDVLQVPQGTVGVRIKRAKEALKKIYDEMNLSYGS